MMSIDNLNSKEFLDYLISIAKTDGIVTSDEQNFISVVEKEINLYQEELNNFLEKGKLDKSGKLSLYHSRMRIVRKALDVVLIDFEFTNDEQKLFSGLKEKLKELADFEEENSIDIE